MINNPKADFLRMDAAFLPKQPASRKYKHFTIDSRPEKTEGGDSKIEFFYVGKSTQKIDLLIQTFSSGYAAENVERAISVLTRVAGTHTIPDFIIVDPSIGESSLLELSHYISDSKIYSRIPFILDASNLGINELQKYRNLRALDEIVLLDDDHKHTLRLKIDFLKKIKNLNSSHVNSRIFINARGKHLLSKNIIKRVFDIVMSLLFIILLSPVFLLIALAIKLESRGPILYVSKRAGKGYKIFDFFKFRTMVLDADKKVQQLSHLNHYNDNDHDENGPVFFKVINDDRITKVGAFLRNTSMDELPQFFNVVMGNMSLVGNRPLPLYEAAKLTTDDWAERFMAPAGITGLWQIKKREKDYMSMEERIKLDIVYSKRYDFMYDLWIMANTPLALLQKSNT